MASYIKRLSADDVNDLVSSERVNSLVLPVKGSNLLRDFETIFSGSMNSVVFNLYEPNGINPYEVLSTGLYIFNFLLPNGLDVSITVFNVRERYSRTDFKVLDSESFIQMNGPSCSLVVSGRTGILLKSVYRVK